MHTKKMAFALALGIFLFVSQRFTAAEDAKAEPQAEASKRNQPYPMVAYRLDFSINELEDGKKLNTRHYSMYITDGEGAAGSVKIGTRVPVQNEGKFDYLDIGTSIKARLVKWEKPVGLNVTAEVSGFPTSKEGTARDTPPLIRQLRIDGSTAIILDKPIIIGSVDDPDSKRSFQLEVIVTKLQ